MKIIIYGKPTCKKCQKAKEKLERMGLPYTAKNLSEMVAWHEGWRDDNSVAILACSTLLNGDMPIIEIQNGGPERKCYSYSQAIKVLKGMKKEK